MRARHVLLLLLVANPAWAEVADKVASTSDYVIWAIGFNVVAFGASYVKRWLSFVIAALALLLGAFAAFDELLDPHVGPAIAQELGRTHVMVAWSSLVLSVVGPVLIGAVLRRR